MIFILNYFIPKPTMSEKDRMSTDSANFEQSVKYREALIIYLTKVISALKT